MEGIHENKTGDILEIKEENNVKLAIILTDNKNCMKLY